MTKTTTFFYATNKQGDPRHKLASLENKVTPDYEVSCTKRYAGGRCVECTLAYVLEGELPVIEVLRYSKGNPPSQWRIHHAEDMAARALRKIRVLESVETNKLEAA